MSFAFQWPRFSDEFHAHAIELLNTALNKGNKPPVIADRIEVVELEMGTQPPELEIRDIGDMTMDQFRGIFRLTYDGDAYIVLRTKVQANPLNHKQPDIHLMAGSRGMLAAKQPLVVPMLLRLSRFKLNSYVVLVVSKQKGITLVFKTDPLQNVDINSTFDSIAVIQKFIQREIEGQLRQMFREDLPGIIHRLSQQWVKAKVEAPYLHKDPKAPSRPIPESASSPDLTRPPGSAYPQPRKPASAAAYRPARPSALGRSHSMTGLSAASSSSYSPPREAPETSFPDLENFDPTYGLRDGTPSRTFGNLRRLFHAEKGLADLTEDLRESEADGDVSSFDGWEDLSEFDPPATVSDETYEYEALPAVGGGTITRPRVIHAQSPLQSPLVSGPMAGRPPWAPSPLTRSTSVRTPVPRAPSLGPRSMSSMSNPYFSMMPSSRPGSVYDDDLPDDSDDMEEPSSPSPRFTPHLVQSSSTRRPPLRPTSPATSPSSRSIVTPPPTEPADDPLLPMKRRERRISVSSSDMDGIHSGSEHYLSDASPRRIIARPTLSNSISQLHTLSHSNHTLSPFTRSFQHFAVRSGPRKVAGMHHTPAADRQPQKAKRKRTFRLGAKPTPPPPPNPDLLSSPSQTDDEFNASEMDRYFRDNEDYMPRYAEPSYPPQLRPRRSYQHLP